MAHGAKAEGGKLLTIFLTLVIFIGAIAGAQVEVAMWSSLLGAVNVKNITIDGAQLSLAVPRASGDALFEEAYVAERDQSVGNGGRVAAHET